MPLPVSLAGSGLFRQYKLQGVLVSQSYILQIISAYDMMKADVGLDCLIEGIVK
jgi:hypothetical protein